MISYITVWDLKDSKIIFSGLIKIVRHDLWKILLRSQYLEDFMKTSHLKAPIKLKCFLKSCLWEDAGSHAASSSCREKNLLCKSVTSSTVLVLLPISPADHYDDDDDDDEEEKALRSRSAARPGDMEPLVTLSCRSGRASRTLGWFWKWSSTFSWIRLHIHTFCWALRRPCSSPLANMASRYDTILAQTSGMPSLVCEEARTTWSDCGSVNEERLVSCDLAILSPESRLLPSRFDGRLGN